MKKLIAVILLLAALFSLTACGDAVSIGSFSSAYFNTDD